MKLLISFLLALSVSAAERFTTIMQNTNNGQVFPNNIALRPTGASNIISFENEFSHMVNVKHFGADGSGVTNNTTAFSNAIARASSLKKGLFIPAGIYSFISSTNIANLAFADTPYVIAQGCTFTNLRPILNGTGTYWEGGTFERYNTTNFQEVISMTGTNNTVVGIVINNAGAPSGDAYTGVEISNDDNVLRDFTMNMQGKGPVTVSYGNRIRISNGTITGADDGINLKSTVRGTSDIVIENIIGINCANVFSIGTEIKFPVRNVTVNNIVGTNCVTLIWIKPGNVNYNSTNSLVENIVITGGSIQDIEGARYQRAVYITGAYTNRMKNITIANITANVRCFTTGTTRAFIHVFPDDGSSVESLNIYNSNFRDANDGLVAGTANQVMWGILLEPSAGGSISNAIFSNIEIYGTGGNGYLETPGSITNVILRDMVFRKNNNGTGSFVVESLAANIELDDIRVLDTPFANPISTAAHTGTNFYMLHAGSNARMWSGFDATRTLTPQVIGTDPILTFSNAFLYVTGTIAQNGSNVALMSTAFESNVSAEFNALVSKSVLAANDGFVLEDSATGYSKKVVGFSNLESSLANVFNKTKTNEIHTLSTKTILVGADSFLIEDSAAGYAKKLSSFQHINDSLSLVNSQVAVGAAIDALKIGGGGVNNTEFSYIGTLTSDAQVQIDNKLSLFNGVTIAKPNLIDSSTAILNVGASTNVGIYPTNLANAQIAIGAAIDAAKIGGGGVSTTEFNYLSTVTSDIQVQLAAKVSNTSRPMMWFAASDETTPLTVGNTKITLRAPHAFTVTAVRCSLTTTSSSGVPQFDINESGVSILGTKLTIDVSEKTSVTAAAAATIADSAIADDAEITVDVDVAGTGATGLKIEIYGTN